MGWHSLSVIPAKSDRCGWAKTLRNKRQLELAKQGVKAVALKKTELEGKKESKESMPSGEEQSKGRIESFDQSEQGAPTGSGGNEET